MLNKYLSKKMKIAKIPEIDIIKEAKIPKELIEYLETIKYFKKRIKTISNTSLLLFNRNINTLLIEKFKNKRSFSRWKLDGRYSISDNIIYLGKRSAIIHELLHVASSIMIDEYAFSGFSQSDLKQLITTGNALNEGYTSLLESRYFSEFHDHDAYVYEKKIAKIIEKIVGQTRMEELYFNADLYELINEMNKYGNNIDILRLMKKLDVVQKLWYNYNTIILKDIRKKAINETLEIVLQMYINKLINLYDNKKIDKNKLYLDLRTTLNDLKNIFKYEKINLDYQKLFTEPDLTSNDELKKLKI